MPADRLTWSCQFRKSQTQLESHTPRTRAARCPVTPFFITHHWSGLWVAYKVGSLYSFIPVLPLTSSWPSQSSWPSLCLCILICIMRIVVVPHRVVTELNEKMSIHCASHNTWHISIQPVVLALSNLQITNHSIIKYKHSKYEYLPRLLCARLCVG